MIDDNGEISVTSEPQYRSNDTGALVNLRIFLF